MKRKILALLLSLAMLLSVGGMVEGTLAVGISVDSTRSSVTLGEVAPVVTPTPKDEPTVEPEGTPEATPETTPDATPAPDTTPAPEDEGEATPTPTVEPEATPTPEGEAEHIAGCSDDCTAEGCACTCHAAQKTPEEDFASMTDEELYAYVKQLSTDEEIEAFLKQLPEERLNALVAYAQAQEPVVVPETVVFTDAGPFMPPVTVTVERMLRWNAARAAAADDSADTGNGLELNKTATANGDGSYTIRMEAYTTGEVITSTKTVPVDIVLVLDQSGSMAYDFNGNSTNTNANRRQYAMKQAVNNFIDKVAEKYTTDADHRMAIVTFGSSADTLQGWTYVVDNETDKTGKGALQKAISGLPTSPSGATNVAAGMKQAETLMGSRYSYTGNNTTKRQKVVIVFTDGVPTTQTNFNVDVANGAISSANTLKNNGVTIYSVGIFKGADPDKIHGDYYYRAVIADTPCDGSVNSYWGTTNLSNSNANDFADPDVPAGNRFLNYISNNYTAANIGLVFDSSDGVFGGYKWKITANYQGSNAGYYLTADKAIDLNNIFQTISENIQSPDIDLGSAAVIKDIIAPSFNVPANADNISLYTEDYDGTQFDGKRDNAPGVTATISGDTISVTGFDYNKYFVSDKEHDGTFGKKLIIEFTTTLKDGFLGGNNVFTNGEKSGLYENSSAENALEAFPQPQVNVPIQDVTVTAADKNVYLLGGLTAAQLKEGATVTVGEDTKVVSLDLSKANENYGLADWQTAYVDITVEVKDKDGTAVTDLNALTADTTYTISVTVAPKNNGDGASGTPATAKSGVNSPAAINVFKPELTFKDSEVYYGDTVPAEYSNLTATVWKHEETLSTAEGVTMIGTAPELTIGYTPDSTKIADSKINTKQDIAVDVAVKINGTDVTNYTTFNHTNCEGKTCTVPEGKEFLLHVKTCTLTITKQGGAADESYVFDVFKDGVKYSEVTIWGNGTETLVELPIGTYTISENTGWSWRYSANDGGRAELTAQNPTGSIACTNTKNNNQWLNGFSEVVKNIFDTANN